MTLSWTRFILAACLVISYDVAVGEVRSTVGQAKPIVLISSHGTLVRTDDDIVTVLVADPRIANVQVVSSRTLFVFGKAPGRTELFVLGSDDEVISRSSVSISRPLSMLPRGN